MSGPAREYLYSLISERIDDLYNQCEDGVDGSQEELDLALETRNELM